MYQVTRRNIPVELNLQQHWSESVISRQSRHHRYLDLSIGYFPRSFHG